MDQHEHLRPRACQLREFRHRMKGGRTAPPLVAVQLDGGDWELVVMKLRQPGLRRGDGHYEVASLTAELSCAIIARGIGLRVPDYFIVDVPRDVARGLAYADSVFEQNEGVHFGFKFVRAAEWQPTAGSARALSGVLGFDVWVINGDRKVAKPNLMWDDGGLILIDHSLALPVHQQSVPAEFMPEQVVDAHCVKPHLNSRTFQPVVELEQWASLVKFAESCVPTDWWRREERQIRAIFDFLREREPSLETLREAARERL